MSGIKFTKRFAEIALLRIPVFYQPLIPFLPGFITLNKEFLIISKDRQFFSCLDERNRLLDLNVIDTFRAYTLR
jgi:hypothetical protein